MRQRHPEYIPDPQLTWERKREAQEARMDALRDEQQYKETFLLLKQTRQLLEGVERFYGMRDMFAVKEQLRTVIGRLQDILKLV